MIDNHFFIKQESQVNLGWFNDFVVENSLDSCVKSTDDFIFLKLPKAYQTVNDVPVQWQADFIANEPYMTRAEAHAELNQSKWQAPVPVGNGF